MTQESINRVRDKRIKREKNRKLKNSKEMREKFDIKQERKNYCKNSR